MISLEVGRADPLHVIGVHVNMLMAFPSGDPAEFAGLSESDQARLGRLAQFDGELSGYMKVMRPRRQISHWTEFNRGGHFAAMEQPTLLTGDIRSFFHSLK